MSSGKLHFISWNSNGLKKKIEEVKSEIMKKNYDVVFLQETRASDEKIFKKLEGYQLFYTTQSPNIKGVAILIKNSIFEESSYPTDLWLDADGCYIVVKCTLKGQLFTLVSVYNCQSNIEPLMKLRSVLEKHAEGILLLGGDFNVPLNPYLDRTSTKRNKHHSLLRPVVKEFMTSFHLVDVWRRRYPTENKYSYKQKNVESRLDYIFVPEESMQYIEMCEISPYKSCSDHYPIVFDINVFKTERQKLGLFMIIFKENKMDVLSVQQSVVDKWLSCKGKYWPRTDLTLNPLTPLTITASEVERAIQSLVLKDVERPDGIPLSFYKSNLHVLIPYLCALYDKVLEQPTNTITAFNEVSETHTFNIDYLILATIMARWLYEHLQYHSTDYTVGDKKTTVLFTYKNSLISVKWSVLNDVLGKITMPALQNEGGVTRRTEPALMEKCKIAALHKILKYNRSKNEILLRWGCPLTPVLVTLYLKHVANEMVQEVNDRKPSIHISKENVIVRLSVKSEPSLNNLTEKYTDVDCTILDFSDAVLSGLNRISLMES
ncbi:uncharacterized protein LOC130567328 [Triplophysa rosa]|uniref:uncharacterized protein LOC130567328 n=1 Tax=Triplophysa rosa TaxID=992332 RepID=UPI002545D2A5|nr:uncharacterized protein LOC130567328 [Triplophysa rosa]XP_057211321.1 uncharacterized protein LOC130567328 [Triplophysa rosa]